MRDERRKQQDIEKEKINDLKSKDPDNYLKSLYDRRKDILTRMTERSRKKEEF